MAGLRFAALQSRSTGFQPRVPPFEAMFMTSAWPTRRRIPCPWGSWLLQALGFLAFTLPQVEILMSTRKPRGQELTLEQQLANQAMDYRRLH